jgi:penicillin-binding protein 1A
MLAGSAILFVASSGLWFREKFRNNPWLVGAIAVLAVVSTVLLIQPATAAVIEVANFVSERGAARGGMPNEVLAEVPSALPKAPPSASTVSISYLDKSGALIGVVGGGQAQSVNVEELRPIILAAILPKKNRRFRSSAWIAQYLNRAYFGNGAYGLEEASNRYFKKRASELSLGEAAILRGALADPNVYDPVARPEISARHATLVLDDLLRTSVITLAQRTEAFESAVRASAVLAHPRARYFTAWIDGQVRSLVGEPTEDLIVETTLDSPLQVAAEVAVVSGVNAAGQGVQAALVAIDGEGRVRAYVGGPNYAASPFDWATAARRRAGSAFMPFVYLAALEAQQTPNSVVVDEPVRIGGWEPPNDSGKYIGVTTLQMAFAHSVNTIAARLANEVETDNVAAVAKRLGIESPISLEPPMALGAVEVSLLEMTQAYAPFANGGFLARGYGIQSIRTANGKVIYDRDFEKRANRSVVGAPSLQYMNQMMREVVISGTGKRARVEGYDIAGKTGTTGSHRDAWFVGYTGGFVTAVWAGKGDNTPIPSAVSDDLPITVWRSFMAAALPRLRAPVIPGGTITPPPQEDLFGPIPSNPP